MGSFVVFVNSAVGVLEVAVHATDQRSPGKKKRNNKKNSHAVKEMAFLCDSLSVSHGSRNKMSGRRGAAFRELLGMSAAVGPLWEGSHQDHMLMYYFLYEGY